MVVGVDHEVRSEAIGSFCGAPGFSKQPVYVGAKHSARVVEAEERIEAHLLELALAPKRPSFSPVTPVHSLRKMSLHVGRIVWIAIGLNDRVLLHEALKTFKERPSSGGSPINPVAVFPRLLNEQALGWHRGDLKPKDPSRAALNGQGDGEGFALGVLKSLQVVKLNDTRLCSISITLIEEIFGLKP